MTDDQLLHRIILFVMDDEPRETSHDAEGVDDVRAVWARAKIEAGKRRAERLRAELRGLGTVTPLRGAERAKARDHVRSLIANDDGQLTLAARGGNALSDADLDAIIDHIAALPEGSGKRRPE